MKNSEIFALNQWLTWYADNLSYSEIIEIMKKPYNSWCCEYLDVWTTVENFPLEQVADFIEDTKMAFERATQNMREITV